MEIATGGTKWWDYSGYFLNLNGRICLEGALVFGLVISLLRYALLILPLAFILSRFTGAVGVWHAFWITEVVTAGIAYFQIKQIAIAWYMIVALVVAGFMVAYAAMFGFDKLKEIMNWGAKK